MFTILYSQLSKVTTPSLIGRVRGGSVFLLLLPFLLFNCAEEQLPAGVQLSLVQHRLHLATSSASFGYNSNLTQTISVTGENTPWTLTGLPDWLTASVTTGNGAATITLTAKENTNVDEARAAVLTFASTAWDYAYSQQITVSQPVATIYITPSEEALSFLPKGEGKTISVTSNVDWTATCSDSHFTVEKVSGTQLRVTAKENLENKTQRATIHFMRSGTTTTYSTIDVTQAEAGVTGSTDNIAFAVDGEQKTTAIKADAAWTATVSDATWLSVTPAIGSAGDATLTIKAQANSPANARSGYVYVRIGTINKLAIPVSQAGIKYTVSPATLTLKSTTEPATVTVSANAAWTVVSKPEWLEVTLPETLVGDVALTLTPQDNPNTTTRSGQVVIGRAGFSGNKTIAVTQEGKTFGDLADMEFPVTGGTQSLTINTDGVWKAAIASGSDWIHLVEPTTGQGNGTLTVRVDANPGKDERGGSLTVTVGQTTQTVGIRQVGLYVKLSCDDVLTTSNPATISLSVASNMSWTAASNVDWLTVKPTQGEGEAALTLSVADNPSLNPRQATVTVKSGEIADSISFTQPGRTLTLSYDTEQTITFNPGGGRSETITVTTDGTYQVTASNDWIKVNESGNTFTITAARSNSINKRIGSVTVSLTDLTGDEKLERTIVVAQNPLTLSVSPESISFTSKGGTSDGITVSTVGTYTVSTSASWLTINRLDDTVFTVTAAANDGAAREATITVSLTGLLTGESKSATVKVTQEEKKETERIFTVTGNGKTVSFKMKLVESGTFTMGATSEQSSDAYTYSDESPTHQVTLTNDYYMGETEVTQALWYAVMGQSPTSDGSKWSSSYGLGDDYPAYYISYTDCQSFLTKLNQMTGQTFRFPTEAEWEFAARGGNESKGYKYAGSKTIGDVAWYTDNSGSKIHTVKTKAANELGMYDMSGNVYEWCYDWYGSYSSSAQTDPMGASSGSRRVRRGGGWLSNAGRCRVSYRNYDTPDGRDNFLGLRLAL